MKRKNKAPTGPKEPKADKLEFDGVVQEALPNAMFRVSADNGLDVQEVMVAPLGLPT